MTSSAVPLQQLAERIEKHLRDREHQLNHEAPEEEPDKRLTLPVVLYVIGAITGTAGIGYAAIAWLHDPLITYRGWIVVACTTTCALCIFVGESRWRQAREAKKAVTPEQVEQLLVDAEIDRVRREHRILEQMEDLTDCVRINGARMDAIANFVARQREQRRPGRNAERRKQPPQVRAEDQPGGGEGGGGRVVPMPNPRIYELGIAEGERRARERERRRRGPGN